MRDYATPRLGYWIGHCGVAFLLTLFLFIPYMFVAMVKSTRFEIWILDIVDSIWDHIHDNQWREH